MKRSSSHCPLPPSLLSDTEWPSVLEALLKKPEKSVRLRPPSANGAGEPLDIPFQTENVPWFDLGRFTPGTHQPGRFLVHAAGAYYIQDAGSMLALALLAPQKDEWIADLCAAPGGKATGILEVVGPGNGFLLANEPISGRVAALQWTLARTGFSRFAVTQTDIDSLKMSLEGTFDAILVDAPCTGQTLVGRGKHTLAGAFNPQAIAHAVARQKRILHGAAQLCCPGGRIVYSTCTLTVEENEEVIEDFLASHPQWSVEEDTSLSPWLSPLAPGGYRLWPHRDRCAGAYAIRLRNSCGAEDTRSREHIQLDLTPETDLPEVLRDSGQLIRSHAFRKDRQWFAWPTEVPQWLPHISALAPEIAFQPAKVFQPAHALALRRDASWIPSTAIELSSIEAQSYLQVQTLSARSVGWAMVHWRGHPLGWIHSNHLRANNGLPAAARLPYPPTAS